MKIRIITVLLLLLGQLMLAQQEVQFTNYMYNASTVNPAYAGTRESLTVLGGHRAQWVGINGAPQTSYITFQTPLGQMQQLGLGVSIVRDKLGPSNQTFIATDLSYNIPVSEESKFSFGMKASVDWLSVDFNKVKLYESNDPLSISNINNKITPNIGVGCYWYSQRAYVGLSVPYFLETKYYNNDISFLESKRKHLYAMAGYVFELNDNLKFKPTFLTKLVSGAPAQFDVSANFLINEKLTLGAAYRVGAAVSGLLGFQINKSWLVGYSYDKDVTHLGSFNTGSHEIFLRYELFEKAYRMEVPRFF